MKCLIHYQTVFKILFFGALRAHPSCARDAQLLIQEGRNVTWIIAKSRATFVILVPNPQTYKEIEWQLVDRGYYETKLQAAIFKVYLGHIQ